MPDASHGGRVLWLSLVILLASLALIEAVAGYLSTSVVRFPALWLTLGSQLLVTVLVAGAAMAAVLLMPREANPSENRLGTRDRLFIAVAVCWLMFALAQAWTTLAPDSRVARLVLYQCYQATLAGVTYLLLTAMTRLGALGHGLWLLQWAGGALVLMWHFLPPVAPAGIWGAWQIGNVLLSAALFLLLGVALLATADLRAWLVMAAALVGFGIGMDDIALRPGEGLALNLAHQVYGGLLILVWMIVSGRISPGGAWKVGPMATSPASQLAQAFAHSGLYGYDEGLHGEQSRQHAADQERRRIAQELHDGVGSQLVGMLAGLDRRDPRERALASGLEQCLLDVKILVDAIDDADEPVTDALGRLRYRVQPSLERLGIALHWDVVLDGSLDGVRRERSRQVLRIAQEALANAMRHSQASAVWLRCHLDAGGRALVLDIRDNGQGMDAVLGGQRAFGKGMEGMRRRAASVGGVLEVSSRQAHGTRVLLTLPLGTG